MPHWTKYLLEHAACSEAVVWAKQYDSLADAWRECQRGDWMLWLAAHGGTQGSDHYKSIVLAACACARLVLSHVPEDEDRPRIAIETAEAWARGEENVSLDDVKKAADAANDAADAADAAAAAYAAYAAAYAAYTAAYAAYTAYAANAAATRNQALAKCAEIVREHVTCPVI